MLCTVYMIPATFFTPEILTCHSKTSHVQLVTSTTALHLSVPVNASSEPELTMSGLVTDSPKWNSAIVKDTCASPALTSKGLL